MLTRPLCPLRSDGTDVSPAARAGTEPGCPQGLRRLEGLGGPWCCPAGWQPANPIQQRRAVDASGEPWPSPPARHGSTCSDYCDVSCPKLSKPGRAREAPKTAPVPCWEPWCLPQQSLISISTVQTNSLLHLFHPAPDLIRFSSFLLVLGRSLLKTVEN